jgi:hypothetical protein
LETGIAVMLQCCLAAWGLSNARTKANGPDFI